MVGVKVYDAPVFQSSLLGRGHFAFEILEHQIDHHRALFLNIS